jgi:hypothetical protein
VSLTPDEHGHSAANRLSFDNTASDRKRNVPLTGLGWRVSLQKPTSHMPGVES